MILSTITYFFAVAKVGILHIQDELLLLQREPVSIEKKNI